jgi:hypothetical protein
LAWTTPRTWAAGELVTAAIGNVHWRDNFNALRATPEFSCSAYRNAQQNVTSGTTAVVTLPNEDWDTGSMHDNTTNSGRIAIPSTGAGRYDFHAKLYAAGAGTALWALQINGSATNYREVGNGYGHVITVKGHEMTATQYVAIEVTASGGDIVVGDSTGPAEWIRLMVRGPLPPT